MSSIIERLTEGVVNRDMRAEGSALLSKWEKTGLLEGLDKDRSKTAMARLLENQAKELLRESSSMNAGDVEGFAAVAFPIVRRVFAGLIANDLVSVQPMSLPSGLIFFLDFVYSPNIGSSSTITDRLGNQADKSIYGTNVVGAEVTGGVNLVGNLGEDLSGPRTVGARGYAYSSPTASFNVTASGMVARGFLIGNGTHQQNRLIDYDPDLLALSGSGRYVIDLQIAKSTIQGSGAGSQLDYNNLGAVSCSIASLSAVLADSGITAATTQQIRRLTNVTTGSNGLAGGRGDGDLHLVFVTTDSSTPTIFGGSNQFLSMSAPQIDDLTNGGALGSVVGQAEWGLEGSELIPEIDIKVDSIAVTAQTKKLKAKWTPELGQDLNAYHNLDAEVELTVQLLVHNTGRVLPACSWTEQLVPKLALALLLPTSPVPCPSGTRLSLRQLTMFLLLSTVRLFVVVLTSWSSALKLLTSLSSLLDSVLPSPMTMRPALSVPLRLVH
jgi:hypothetical protein